MSAIYTLSESISGFRRTKLASFVSIFTISIALLFLGIFAFASMQAAQLIESLRNKVHVDVFLDEGLPEKSRHSLQRSIEKLPGVSGISFVSKDEAVRIFREEFGDDISSVLDDYNPLPASFKVSLHTTHQTAAVLSSLEAELSKLPGVNTVKYPKELIEVLDQRDTTVYHVTLGLGVLIGLSAIFLVSNTVRLAIYAKRKLIRTMELVGATALFIRTPFLLEGVLHGAIGGGITAAMFFLVVRYSSFLLPDQIAQMVRIEPVFYAGIVVGGVLLGVLGSMISVTRFVKIVDSR